jgi:hypothetical protein
MSYGPTGWKNKKKVDDGDTPEPTGTLTVSRS